jgi:hypothetical protein
MFYAIYAFFVWSRPNAHESNVIFHRFYISITEFSPNLHYIFIALTMEIYLSLHFVVHFFFEAMDFLPSQQSGMVVSNSPVHPFRWLMHGYIYRSRDSPMHHVSSLNVCACCILLLLQLPTRPVCLIYVCKLLQKWSFQHSDHCIPINEAFNKNTSADLYSVQYTQLWWSCLRTTLCCLESGRGRRLNTTMLCC